MTELKTLKDLEKDFSKISRPLPIDIKLATNNYPFNIVETEDLRQEAIKWIKGLREHKFYCVVCEKFDCDCSSSDYFKPRSEGVESWIMHNYDISEEDLK